MKTRSFKISESIFGKLFLVYFLAACLVLALFETTEEMFSKSPSETVLGLSALFILILVGTFAVTRRILAPLKTIEAGVMEFGAGNLNVKLPATSRDEFGRIEESFNLMAERVRSMLKSKEQLLFDVSHEFRTPLSRVRIALEVPGDERASIKESILEMEAMISELLESARMDDVKGGLKKEACDLSKIVRDLASHYEGVRPGIKILENGVSLSAMLDGPRIRIALKNILDNAIKYSSNQEKPVEVGVGADKSSIFISVRDFGIGISKEHQELIFEPFYRVDRSRIRDTGGYGLGLSLARKIISAHGGTLNIESELGSGTIFKIELNRN